MIKKLSYSTMLVHGSVVLAYSYYLQISKGHML